MPAEITPHTRYDPVLPPVEPGTRDITIEMMDRTLYVAKDMRSLDIRRYRARSRAARG